MYYYTNGQITLESTTNDVDWPEQLELRPCSWFDYALIRVKTNLKNVAFRFFWNATALLVMYLLASWEGVLFYLSIGGVRYLIEDTLTTR